MGIFFRTETRLRSEPDKGGDQSLDQFRTPCLVSDFTSISETPGRINFVSFSTHPDPDAWPAASVRRLVRLDRLAVTLGRERAFREKILRPAQLREGESVLDVGCGTGSLAILAKRQVGPGGHVHGIDGSPEMIERARRKARRAGADVDFAVAPAQALPFEAASFDVVLSTLMIHHLPRPSRGQLAAEMKRVLKPGGRALAVDFAKGKKKSKGLIGLIHTSHGSTRLEDIIAPLSAAGLDIVATGPAGTKNLHFVLAQSPGGDRRLMPSSVAHIEPELSQNPRGRFSHPLILVSVVLLLILHFAAGASLIGDRLERVSQPVAVAITGAVVAVLIVKAAVLSRRHRRSKKSD